MVKALWGVAKRLTNQRDLLDAIKRQDAVVSQELDSTSHLRHMKGRKTTFFEIAVPVQFGKAIPLHSGVKESRSQRSQE